MTNFNFTADYDFEDGALVADTTLEINGNTYGDRIPFFYEYGFLLDGVTNTIDEVLSEEQEQQIQQTLNELTAKVRADIKKELPKSSINIISHDNGELKFYLNFMDYCFTCKHYDGDEVFYILQDERSYSNDCNLWSSCQFLLWSDLVI